MDGGLAGMATGATGVTSCDVGTTPPGNVVFPLADAIAASNRCCVDGVC